MSAAAHDCPKTVSACPVSNSHQLRYEEKGP